MSSPRHAGPTFTAPDLQAIEAARAEFKSAELARNTVLSYDRDWRVFRAWCEAAGRTAMPAPADLVELYCVDLLRRGRKVTTVMRHIRGIQYQHRTTGHENPITASVRQLLSGARRILAQRPAQKEALLTEDIRAMVAAIDRTAPIGARNAALLLFGFASALRRSSLARLELRDLTFTPEGLLVVIRWEKQDREGKTREIAIPLGRRAATCPVRAMKRWLGFRGDEPGLVFTRVHRGHTSPEGLLGNRIGQIVQEAAAAVNLDRSKYGAHSLRAGFVTEALERGTNELAIARHTGHRSLDTLRLYVRSRSLFRGNACRALGL